METKLPARAGAGPSTRLPSLTGLRFIAAMLVFCFHITLSDSPIPPNDPINLFADDSLAANSAWLFSKAGYLGVSFFFVLSGFVLTWSSKPSDSLMSFWRRRMLKIFPNHLVMWVLAMVLFAAAITEPRSWLPNIFLLHSFFPQPETYVGVNPPSWTLCCELLFYVLFPFLLRPVQRIRQSRLWFWAGVMVAGMVAVQLVTQFIIPDEPRSPITPVSVQQFWFGYIFPPSRLFEFVLGIVLARIVISGRWLPISIGQAAGLSVVGYVVALFVPFLYGFNVATIIPVAALICAAAAADAAGRPTVLSTPRMQWLGEISFGFYLCQGVVIFYGRQLIGAPDGFGTPMALLVTLGFFVATLIGGWLLYSRIEHPVMRRWSRPRRPAASTTPPVRPGPAGGAPLGEAALVVPAPAPVAPGGSSGEPVPSGVRHDPTT
ncbi:MULTISPECIES: acyltransferase family protein [unclassified Micromonospora]|uniref:acyltransferase family protein n=1 Tax=unclassified Micromonospora TaxID=2617518 RepID=UPI003633D9B0